MQASKPRISKLILLCGVLSLASCGVTHTLSGGVSAVSTPHIKASLPVRPTLGLYQLAVTGATLETLSASVTPLSPSVRAQGLEVSGLSFTPLSFGTYTDEGTHIRYLRASFKVVNNSGQDLNMPTYIPVDTTGQNATAGTTPFSQLKYFDGSDASARAGDIQLDTAHQLNASTGANEVDPAATPLVTGLDTHNLVITPPAGTTVASIFQQGWQGAALPSGGSQLVTFAVKVPMAATAAQDPFSFSLVFTVADNPDTLANADYTLQKDRWRSLLVPASTDTSNTYMAAQLQEINNGAQEQYSAMNKSPDRTKLWNDLPTPAEDSATIPSNFSRLQVLAVAYSTPGAALYQNPQLKTDILGALDWLYKNYYNETIPESGNWYSWEIGGPKALTNVMLLMERDLTPQQLTNLTNALLRFVPDPKIKAQAGTGALTETGANLMDKVMIFNRVGLLLRDDAKINRALAAISELFNYVTTGVGYYADGGYVDHATTPYTASYGIVLFLDISNFLYVSQGSRWPVTDPGLNHVYEWAYNAYEPMLYRGRILDLTAGRAVARGAYNDLGRGYSVTNALLYLAQNAPPSDAARLRSLAKYMIVTDPDNTFYKQADLPTLALAAQSLGSVVPRGDASFEKQYPSMDRVVHARNGWLFSVAGSSNRISNYESINDENLKGWYTADGAVYFYNATSPNFSYDFWPTVDPYRMPGTTEASVDTFPRSAASVNVAQKYLSPRTWVGGSQVGDFGSWGMDFKADGNRQVNGTLTRDSTVTAKKSYFMFDNEVVMLGAGIKASAGEDVQTTVENRQLGPNNLGVILNGGGYADGTQTVQSLNIPGVGGYVFFGPQQVSTKQETRSGQWHDINVSTAAGGSGWTRDDGVTPTTTVQKTYQTVWIDHGVNPQNATYAYVQLPNASADQTQSYAQNPDVTVLTNTPSVQAVQEKTLGITGANFFEAGKAGENLTANAAASVTYQEQGGNVTFGISDPTQAQTQPVVIEYNRPVTGIISSDPAITVLQTTPNLKVQVNFAGLQGRTLTLRASYDPASSTVSLSDPTATAPAVQTASLIATDDTYVRDGTTYADNNYNAAKPNVRFSSATASGFNCMTYLKFNLTGLSSVSAAQLQSAKLRVNGSVTDGDTTKTSATLQAFGAASNNWQEATLTWNTRPALTTGYGTTTLSRTGAWAEMDVLDLVKQALSQGQTDLTVAVYQPSAQAVLSQMAARTSGTPETLVINYTK